MATPSYTTLISGVVTRLRNDNRLNMFNDGNIYFGSEPNIPGFPAITVELQEAQDVWKTYPTNKDMVARLLITIMERSMLGYVSGIQAIEGYCVAIDNVFHTDTKISGICYNSEVGNRRFGTGVVNETPVFVCEMELQTVTRYDSRH